MKNYEIKQAFKIYRTLVRRIISRLCAANMSSAMVVITQRTVSSAGTATVNA